jgi:acetoin utilization deacetylase AcuC-like enzyme
VVDYSRLPTFQELFTHQDLPVTTVFATHPRYPEHNLPGHPEHAGRIRAVWQQLDESGLVARMKSIEVGPVERDLLVSVHTSQYLDTLAWIQETQQHTVHLDADTYAGPTSYEIARLAVGGVVGAISGVLNGQANNGLAVVRPPGHHAMPNHGMGFCLLGNIAIGARYAQRAYNLKRVMIVDFDVHHGNGTEAMFYDDDTVLFVSTHQSPFYPGTGAITDIGADKGRGYTINVPLGAGHGDASYGQVFEHIVWPAARRFQPELILVSAGFDAHWTDPLAQMRLSLTGYAHLTHELLKMAEELCGGKIVFVMEGGYHLDALSHGVRNIAHALLGDTDISDPLGPPQDRRHEPEIEGLIEQVRTLQNLS